MKIENKEEERLKLELACKDMAEIIGETLPDGVGFALILSDFGSVGNLAYCSNVERDDMIKLLHEITCLIEGCSN